MTNPFSTDLPFQKPSKVLGVVGADPQKALLEVDDNAIPTPEIPNPASTQAVVDTPAIEDGRLSNLDLLDVGVTHRSMKKWHWTEANRQSVALVHDGQMMECRGEQSDQQADAASDIKPRVVPDHPAEDEAKCGRRVENQAQRSLLGV